MRSNLLLALCFALLFLSCGSEKKLPDVSSIKIELTTHRFERDFFRIDTNNIPSSLTELSKKYPVFTIDFLTQLLGIPLVDSSGARDFAIKKFISDYTPIKDSVDAAISDFSIHEKEIRKGLQYLKHYFPEYNAPRQLITFIGPMDAYAEGETAGYGDIITTDALGIGLQLHLGSNSSFYLSEIGQRLYPTYISRRFAPEYISVNSMKNIIDDLFPGNPADRTLLEQMVDKGKRLYLLDQLLPFKPDSLKIGYTSGQLAGAEKNEGLIWNFFLENNLLYETDYQKIKSYVGDGPKTNELGEGSPGYIALFTGRQIVRTYMEKFPKTSLKELLALDAKTLLSESEYKPR